MRGGALPGARHGEEAAPRPQRGLRGKVAVKEERLRVHDMEHGALGDPPAGFEITVSV